MEKVQGILITLREYISGRMRSYGIAVTPGEILITNGSAECDRPDTEANSPNRDPAVFLESPTYGMIIPALAYYKL